MVAGCEILSASPHPVWQFGDLTFWGSTAIAKCGAPIASNPPPKVYTPTAKKNGRNDCRVEWCHLFAVGEQDAYAGHDDAEEGHRAAIEDNPRFDASLLRLMQRAFITC